MTHPGYDIFLTCLVPFICIDLCKAGPSSEVVVIGLNSKRLTLRSSARPQNPAARSIWGSIAGSTDHSPKISFSINFLGGLVTIIARLSASRISITLLSHHVKTSASASAISSSQRRIPSLFSSLFKSGETLPLPPCLNTRRTVFEKSIWTRRSSDACPSQFRTSNSSLKMPPEPPRQSTL